MAKPSSFPPASASACKPGSAAKPRNKATPKARAPLSDFSWVAQETVTFTLAAHLSLRRASKTNTSVHHRRRRNETSICCAADGPLFICASRRTRQKQRQGPGPGCEHDGDDR